MAKSKRKYTEVTFPVGFSGYCNVANKSKFGNFEFNVFIPVNDTVDEFIAHLKSIEQENIAHEKINNKDFSSDTAIRSMQFPKVTDGGDFPEGHEGEMYRITLRSKTTQPTVISSDGVDITAKLSKELPRGLPVTVTALLGSYTVGGTTGTSMYPSKIEIMETSDSKS